jgi:hypothetical protein
VATYSDILHFSALLQEQNAPSGTFLHRTDFLAVRLGLRVEDLPLIVGISRRTLFVCRSADSAVTSKSWCKLELAEQLAGIHQDTVPAETAKAGSSASPKEFFDLVEKKERVKDPFPPSLARLQAITAQVQADLAALQAGLHDFPMVELFRRMTAAHAWPPTGPDLELTPSELYHKYPAP